MLPTNRRVKKEFFAEIMKNGRLVSGKDLYVRFLLRKDDKPSLFSFVIPNKVGKTSVKRHLVKRKMTASVEKVLKKLKPGISAIFFAKKDLSDIPYREIEKELLDLLSKIGYTL